MELFMIRLIIEQWNDFDKGFKYIYYTRHMHRNSVDLLFIKE